MPYYIGNSPKRKRRRPSVHNRNIKVGKGRTRRRNVLINPHIKKITKTQYNRIRKLNPKGDYDRDGVRNKDDCFPFDEKKQDRITTNTTQVRGLIRSLKGVNMTEEQERKYINEYLEL